MIQEHRRFLDPLHRLPQRLLDGVRYAGQERGGRERVPRVTAEALDRALADLDQRALAFGAREKRKGARFEHALVERAFAARDADFHAHALHDALAQRALAWRGRPHEPREERAHLGDRDDVVDPDVLEHAFGHAGALDRRRILHDRRSTAVLDAPHARRAVVERALQDDADHARAVRVGGAAKQRVDCRPEAVRLGTFADEHPIGARSACAGRAARRRCGPARCARRPLRDRPATRYAARQRRQEARRIRRLVLHDEHRHREGPGQRRHKLGQRVGTARRCSDDDDVATCHDPSDATQNARRVQAASRLRECRNYTRSRGCSPRFHLRISAGGCAAAGHIRSHSCNASAAAAGDANVPIVSPLHSMNQPPPRRAMRKSPCEVR